MSNTTYLCGHCRTELPADAQFCFSCGSQVGGDVRCRGCQAANPAGAAFCQQCGQQLPRPGEIDPVDELRQELSVAGRKLDAAEEQNRLNDRERRLYTEELRSSRSAQAEQQVDAARLAQGAEFEIAEFEREGLHRQRLDAAQREDEAHRQRETFQSQGQDRQRAREHERKLDHWDRKRAELQREMDYKRDLVAKSQELTAEQRAYKLRQLDEEHQLKLERARRDLEARNELSEQEQVARIAREQREFAHRHEQQQVEQQSARDRRNASRADDLAHQRAQAELESETDARDLQLALDAQRQAAALKQQQKDADARRELDTLRGQSEVASAAAREEHDLQLERLDKLNTLAPEALIAASPAEQARLLAELRQTEALKGMTEEQILARAAERSPAVAAAIAEKYRSAGSQASKAELLAVYERMFSAQQSQSQQHQEALQRLMETALQTQRDTAVAAASSGRPPVAAPAAASPSAFCRACGQPLAAGSRFCGKCGGAQG